MTKTVLLMMLAVMGCGAASTERRTRLVISAGDGINEADALAACNVWAEFVDCTTVGKPNTSIVVGPSFGGGQDVYATTELTSITIDTAWLERDGVPLAFALAHEFGHRIGIIDHVHGPALMALDAAGTWLRAELSDTDRDAARIATASLADLRVIR